MTISLVCPTLPDCLSNIAALSGHRFSSETFRRCSPHFPCLYLTPDTDATVSSTTTIFDIFYPFLQFSFLLHCITFIAMSVQEPGLSPGGNYLDIQPLSRQGSDISAMTESPGHPRKAKRLLSNVGIREWVSSYNLDIEDLKTWLETNRSGQFFLPESDTVCETSQRAPSPEKSFVRLTRCRRTGRRPRTGARP